MKKISLFAAFLLFISAAYSQKLFTYGKYSVDAKEFLRAFEKNNSIAPAVNRSKAIKDYLDLYIKSKLKVREAYSRRYDTIPSLISEVENPPASAAQWRNFLFHTYQMISNHVAANIVKRWWNRLHGMFDASNLVHLVGHRPEIVGVEEVEGHAPNMGIARAILVGPSIAPCTLTTEVVVEAGDYRAVTVGYLTTVVKHDWRCRQVCLIRAFQLVLFARWHCKVKIDDIVGEQPIVGIAFAIRVSEDILPHAFAAWLRPY